MRRDVLLGVLLVVSLGLAVVRFFVPGHGPSGPGTYEALAHCWVGGLLGAWLADRQGNRWCGWLALGLSVVEVVAFALGRLT